MNGDGFGDIAAADPYLSRTIWTYSGRDGSPLHTWSSFSPLPTGFILRSINLADPGDLDGDLLADVVASEPFAGLAQEGCITAFSGGTGAILWQYFGSPVQRIGSSIDWVGDTNGDGVNDILAIPAPSLTNGFVLVLSGANGIPLLAIPPPPGAATTFPEGAAGVGDLDGDSLSDILVFSPDVLAPGYVGRVLACSGATGAVIYSWWSQTPGDRFGRGLEGGKDLDGDGASDILLGGLAGSGPLAPGIIRAYSGTTAQVMYAVTGTDPMWQLANPALIGDVDGDGLADFAAREGSPYSPSFFVFKGSDGTLLRSVTPGIPGQFSVGFYAGHDVNADGIEEVVLTGDRTFPPPNIQIQGRVWVYSVAPETPASARRVGVSCGSPAPLLWVQPPVLGATCVLSLSGVPGASGTLFGGAPAATPVAIPGGCTVLLEPASLFPLGSFVTDPGGGWSAPFLVPSGVVYAGSTFRVQAALVAPAGPISLTNAVDLILGY